jgi:TolB-like protein
LQLIKELQRRNVFRVATAYVVVAWLLIQVAETIFPLFGFSDTPARVVVIVLAIGLLPTLVLAWVFELTPEGLRKETDIDPKLSITPRTGKKLDQMIMLVLALALGFFAFDKFVLQPQRELALEQQKIEEVAAAREKGRSDASIESYGDQSIAVLPFINMSDDGANEYFSDGISEELLNLLSRVSELRVISRSSAFSYKNKDINIVEVGRALNVAHILEGSVRKSGNQVRITAQLIDARSDTHLWSETYDRTLDDIFTVQDEIAATVVDRLRVILLGEVPTLRPTDPEAFALLLQARHLGDSFATDVLNHSNELYQQALAIDPEYAEAWTGLSRNYINLTKTGGLPFRKGYDMAREAARKALDFDPDFALAYAVLGYIAMSFDEDYSVAARYVQRAIERDPANININRIAASLLRRLRRLDQAISLGDFVISRDPANPIGHRNLSTVYLLTGQLDQAIASRRKAMTLNSNQYEGLYFIGMALLLKGEAQAALDNFVLEEREFLRAEGTVLALYSLGRLAEYEAKLAELIEDWGEEWPNMVARAYAFTGDVDTAFIWLDKSLQGPDPAGFDPDWMTYKALYDDPRWLQLLERSGLSHEQLDTIKLEIQLPR